ncbi:uncharacterized protein LOC128242939 [Mya arenaria]|uniref:uncharacterized protein LOC128242939 n=1 Tax=Mya arenaria TaxID=6604 RepID=UPI0022DFB044|nr:uncharacterized protein LOC128242939 [Mya arenaria]XP_052816351.1 uncharacterized protein LOC128242939 [Mya arenaria]XP_052816352.1 uncharacterized protein LOC128242939 [Mya arenaria]
MKFACELTIKRHAVICIVLNVLLMAAFLILITIWAFVRASLTIPQESSSCIDCDTMMSKTYTTSGPRGGHSAIIMREDGMCCGPVKILAQTLLQEEMVEQYFIYSKDSQTLLDILDESMLAECEKETNNRQPVSKVVGIVEFKPSYTVDSHYRVLWNKNGRTFSANNCIHLELEGEIFVRQPGYYIVSSQLNLKRQKDTSTSRNETRPTIFNHHVDLLSHQYGTTGILMQTKKSIERKDGYYSSFLSAVFKLNKHDRLSVSVSNPEYLDIDNPNNHFLAYYTYDLPY